MAAILAPSGLRAEFQKVSNRIADVWRIVPRPRRLGLIFATLIMVVTSAGNTAVAVLLGALVDRVRHGLDEGWSRETLYWAAGSILGWISLIYLTRETLHVWRRYLVEANCTGINRDMQTRLVSHVLKTDLKWMTQEKVGALHGKIFRSVDGLVRFVRLMFLDSLPAVFTGLFALSAAITKRPSLGLVMLGVAPLSIWLTIRQLLSQQSVRLALMRDCEKIDGSVVEQLSGAEYIRVANTYSIEEGRLAAATGTRRKREMRHHFQMSLYGFGKALNEGFFHVVLLALATYFAVHEQISFGDILVFSVLYLSVMTPLNEIHRVLDEGHEAGLRVSNLLDMLREPPDCSFRIEAAAAPRLEKGRPAVQIENLVVEYPLPDGQVRRVLDGVSLSIFHGETVGVAGRSGSGKTTWIKVLLRLLHPKEGQVTLGSLSLPEIDRAAIAQQFAYVGQNPFVFSGTIAGNISYGNGDVSQEKIEEAARLAHLHDEILQMPGGYQARVSEHGLNLSGGQRQRLAIARILLKRAPLLILDEATSALDNISERGVQRALGLSSGERTTILIAHRLSTLHDCNRILVFDQGRIVGVGTYEELLQAGGLFAELVHSAQLGAQDGERVRG